MKNILRSCLEFHKKTPSHTKTILKVLDAKNVHVKLQSLNEAIVVVDSEPNKFSKGLCRVNDMFEVSRFLIGKLTVIKSAILPSNEWDN